MFNQFVNTPNIRFYDKLGRLLDSYEINDLTEFTTFNLDYPSGIYYVETIVDDIVKTQKLIISK